MWKLPMFGCTDSAQVMKELGECKKEYPQAWIRIIGFDNVRQVQCISFIASKPEGYTKQIKKYSIEPIYDRSGFFKSLGFFINFFSNLEIFIS
ncbi:putative ribulose-bisphosphate carboxylase [Helianthus annuus]|nr:putative ribulose-bisphosphate carboxylase [Helianthus annuus]